MVANDELLALADELESCGPDCDECPAFEQAECRGYRECTENVSKYCARRIREAVERDGEGATTVSAYDLLPEEDLKALAWVREHGGLDAVEKRLMPEGMEWLLDVWPRWSNGEYCKFGDWWKAGKYGEREPQQLSRLVFFTPEQLREWGQDEGENFGYEWDYMRPSDTTYRPDKVEPPAPKVLDADGVEIRVGDRLYDTDTGCGRTVRAVNDNGTVEFDGHENRGWFGWFLTHRAPVLAADGKPLEVGQTVWRDDGEMLEVLYLRPDGLVDCCGEIERPERLTHDRPVLDADGVEIRVGDTVYVLGFGEPLTVKGFTDDGRVLMSFHDENSLGYKPSKLTHEQPDTWERLEHDAEKTVCEYFGANYDCANCPLEPARCDEEAKKDIIRRAKKLAERGA